MVTYSKYCIHFEWFFSAHLVQFEPLLLSYISFWFLQKTKKNIIYIETNYVKLKLDINLFNQKLIKKIK